MEKKSIKEFVADWMEGHESETFVKNEHGRYIYNAGHSSINLVSFFEGLLEDYEEELRVLRDYETQQQIYKNYPNLNASKDEMFKMKKIK